MYQDLTCDARFWQFLFTIDQDLAEKARKQGCSCVGHLHRANYPRQPRGDADQIPKQQRIRLSFCCDRDGCRKRVTPRSVRFLGRKVFVAAAVILITAMRQGPTPRRLRELSQRFHVDRRTGHPKGRAGRSSGASTFPGHHSGRSHAPVWCRLSRSPPCPTPSWTPSSNLVLRASARVGSWVMATMMPAGTPPHLTLRHTQAGSSCFAFSRRPRSPQA